ncbi:unnamed protein product [Lepeophtheirus salmonis]|uniref:(salmon louse) hypothetical protein n=1 Tax=Lepeophtheirus salmonis TaxID=72036 RepID=A0A7R8D656_LEPSM|nr:unnamed protein product [Lepeophtheirus salmonis]CAF3041740.1 unnamed protein product [Lepeophtheirus salmonis]
MIDAVNNFVEDDKGWSVGEIILAFNLSYGTIKMTLMDEVDLPKCDPRWTFKKTYFEKSKVFLDFIITVYETNAHFYTPETTAINGSRGAQCPHQLQSDVSWKKQMCISWFCSNEFIHEHHV